ncbi:MAG: hypothetical protein VB102_03010 [Paludibacter sp.]|nr:hypothetical protein [Paludibacter sp.]
MRKLLFIFVTGLFTLQVSAQDQQTIAAWTFDKWLGGGATGVPEGQFVDAFILPDDGLQKETAKFGTEQMFDPEVLTVSRKWSTPSKAGYVRCNSGWNNLEGLDRYFQASFSTTGLFNISITSSHATSGTSSSYQFSFTLQYRIGDGPWTNITPKKIFDVTHVSETEINTEQVKDIKLPAEANGKVNIDVRWLFGPPTFVLDDPDPNALTNWQTAWNTGTQIRVDNIFIKGYKVATGPTIFNSYSDIDFGEVPIGGSKTETIQILASKVTGTLSAATSAPFSLSKTSISGVFNEFNTTVDVTFSPTEEGVFEKDFTLTGTGVSKTVKLKGMSGATGIKSPKNDLNYVSVQNGFIKIDSPESQRIIISDVTGKIYVKENIEKGVSTFRLEKGQLYIVSIGGKYKKIIL